MLPEEIDVEQRRAQLETYENLQKDVEDLQDLFSEFSQQVHVSLLLFTGVSLEKKTNKKTILFYIDSRSNSNQH